MAELTVPRLDFSALGDLPQTYRQARDDRNTRMTLASLGQSIQDGTLDYTKAAGQALATGNAQLGLSLLKLGEDQKKIAREQAASTAFQSDIKSMFQPNGQSAPSPVSVPGPQSGEPRGIRNNNPLNLEASAFTQARPGFSGSDGRFGQFATPDQGLAAADKLLASYGQRGINTIAGVINRWAPANDGNPVSAYAQFVAQKAGVDPNTPINLSDPSVRAKILPAMAEFENGRPVQVASLGGAPTPDTQPQQPAQQTAQLVPQQQPQPVTQGEISPRVVQLIGAMANPNLPASQKELAKTLLTRELDNSKLPDPVKQYLFAKGQGYDGSFMDYQTAIRKAGATNVTVDQKGETKFEEEFGKKQADRWVGYMNNADAARRKLVDINTMREISTRLGSQGAAAGVKDAIGPYAEALGINIDGLSDIQAYNQVIQRLAPQQRAPGSGSTSDIEFKGFIKSLPGLSQNPAAREVGLNTMEALARDDVARGQIASRLATGEIKRAEAEQQLRALPDPMKGFVEWRKANPEIYGQALKGANVAPQGQPAASQPQRRQPGQMPRVNSPAELKSLGLKSGDQFMDDQGNIRRVP